MSKSIHLYLKVLALENLPLIDVYKDNVMYITIIKYSHDKIRISHSHKTPHIFTYNGFFKFFKILEI